MKRIFTLVLFVLTCTFGFGQNNYQDVVYLKNGSIIRGIIVEQVPNQSIKIETADKSIFVYPIDDIQKMTKEEKPMVKNNYQISAQDNEGLRKGYRGITEVGYQFGLGTYGLDRLKFNMINGGQFSPFFYLGGGVGLRYYFDDDVALIPVFVHARTNIMDKKISPYFAFSIGYSFNASDDFRGAGLLLSPSSGVTFKVSEKVNLNVGISYEMQSLEFYDYYYGSYGSYYSDYYRENSGALSIDFRLSF